MNIVFYDFETTGRSPQWDQIIQVGAILCDKDLIELERFEMKCSLNNSIVPAPQALLVNNLSVGSLQNQNISNYSLVQRMMNKFSEWSPAIFIGYNSISFDEEFMRNALFQNLHQNPYLTQTNNNKRADVYHIVQASTLYIPTGINIPDGNNKFKLENLAPSNNIDHNDAHDALADVTATIGICKIIKNKFPEFWDYSLKTSSKTGVSDILENSNIICHHESYYGKIYPYVTTYLGKYINRNNSEINICFDLKKDPEDYLILDKNDLKELMKNDKILRKIRNNRHPIIMPKDNAMNFPAYQKIGMDEILRRADIIKNNRDFITKVLQILEDDEQNIYENQAQLDIYEEESIYIGGFAKLSDKLLMTKFHDAEWEEKKLIAELFDDKRYTYFAKKLIHQHNPNLLDKEDREFYTKTISLRMLSNNTEKWLTIPEAFTQVDDLREKYAQEEAKLDFLDEFNSYLEKMLEIYQSGY